MVGLDGTREGGEAAAVARVAQRAVRIQLELVLALRLEECAPELRQGDGTDTTHQARTQTHGVGRRSAMLARVRSGAACAVARGVPAAAETTREQARRDARVRTHVLPAFVADGSNLLREQRTQPFDVALAG
jgi:hypothetical protein